MSIFEFTFGLTAVILGLALTQLVSSAQRLALAGRRVRWAPEPVLLTVIVIISVVVIWLSEWRLHEVREVTAGGTLLNIAQRLMVYLAAATVLPESVASEGQIDLLEHYDRTRRLAFGALSLSQLFPVIGIGLEVLETRQPLGLFFLAINIAFLAIDVALMWVRSRRANMACLLVNLALAVPGVLLIRVAG